ncbi:MAG: FHA domain-containing protein [Pseudomonas sp.]|uniref:FHA domain-containing protein n=1 Tax=Pseudomonas sp. TaxID=306 RepID=UPI00339535A3
MLKLQFKDHRQAPIWLADERFTLGQYGKNDLVLEDSGISPFHAEIRQEQGLYYLFDCGSQEGSFVNGERVSGRYQVRANDCIRLGSVEFDLINPSKTPQRNDAMPRWFLQVIQGEQEGKKFPVTASLTFGRSVKCDLCFSDLELSRRHCEFFVEGESLEVKDLGSSNGVFVNRQKITTAVLQAGDQLQMGAVRLLVIGPKVTQAPEQDEDATLFVPIAAAARPVRTEAPTDGPRAERSSPPGVSVASAPAEASAPVAGRGRAGLFIGVLVLAVVLGLVITQLL